MSITQEQYEDVVLKSVVNPTDENSNLSNSDWSEYINIPNDRIYAFDPTNLVQTTQPVILNNYSVQVIDVRRTTGVRPSTPEVWFPSPDYNPHYWLTDIRRMGKMLASNDPLPHQPHPSLKGNSRQRRKQRRHIESCCTCFTCDLCYKAHQMRIAYRKNQYV